jgi:ketosteroid isomerase-like protein
MNFLEQDWTFKLVLGYREMRENPGTVERNRSTLLGALDKLVAGDVEGFWSIYSPDVVFHEAPCLPYGGAHHGLAATKEAVDRMSRVYAKLRTDFEQVLFGGDIALVYQTVTYQMKGTGETGSMPVAELYRFRDGKVIEWRAMYFDASIMARAAAAALAS